ILCYWKRIWQNAYDEIGHSVYGELSSDHRGIQSEAAFPESVAQKKDLVLTGDSFRREKPSALVGCDAEQRQHADRELSDSDFFGGRADRRRARLTAAEQLHALEDRCLPTPDERLAGRHADLERLLGSAPPENVLAVHT